jgi:hypothetical protein
MRNTSANERWKEYVINHDWRNIVRVLSTQKIQTINVPADEKTMYLRQPSKPINEV